MQFTRRLRDGVRRGRIRCTVRIWQAARVKVGGRYPLEGGHVVVDSIETIEMADITRGLARESGFESLDDLLATARHGSGDHVFLIRFHYLASGAWDTTSVRNGDEEDRHALLRRIQSTKPPASRRRKAGVSKPPKR